MDITRRNFMKAAGATAGVMVATGWSPFAYAQNEKVRLAIIGIGSQNMFHIEHGIAGNPQIQIVAMADVLRPSLGSGVKLAFSDPAQQQDFWKNHCYLNYKEMLDKEKDNIDAVLIATPFKTHYDIVIDCLDAGKYVFCEKTMADTYERCRNIVTKCHETGKWVQCGHQRRYNPEYLHVAKCMLGTDQRAGRVQYIEGQWHRNGDWRRPMPGRVQDNQFVEYQLSDAEKALIKDYRKLVNWRVYEEYSSGLISELATHHIEVVNWLLGTPPKRVWATGGIDYWKDDRDTYDNVVLVFEYEISKRHHSHVTASPKAGIEQLDPAVMGKPYTVRFTWTGTLQSSIKGEGLMLMGDRGTFKLREQFTKSGRGCSFQLEPTIEWLDPNTMEPTTDEKIISWIKATKQSQKFTRLKEYDVIQVQDEIEEALYDKDPDVRQFEAFAKHIKEGGVPRTNQMCGLMASVCDIAAHEASKTKTVVEIDPAVYKFDFETPNPFELGVELT